MTGADILERLPDAAARKLRLLDGLAMSALDTARSAQERLNKIAVADDPNIERLQRILADGERKQAELFDLCGAITRWVRSLPSHLDLELVAVDPPPREEGESAEGSVQKLRAKINQLANERERVRRARLPKDDLKAAMRSEAAKLAQAARPSLQLDHQGRAEPIFADPRGDFAVTAPYIAGLLCWFDLDGMVERLDEMVDNLPDEGWAMPAEEREARLIELEAEIEALERSEEALIERAYAHNVDLLRRANASPVAVLGVRIVAKTPEVERPARKPRPAPIAAASAAE